MNRTSPGRVNYWNCILPQNRTRTPEQVAEHLIAHRHITERGCWEWTGLLSKSGYGKITWRAHGDLRVHRVAAMLWLGMAPDDARFVCHHCDNPPCFNPQHLFLGTAKDNQLDCVRKHRNHNQNKAHCKHGHEFTPDNTWIDVGGYRHCRECHRKSEFKRARDHRRSLCG